MSNLTGYYRREWPNGRISYERRLTWRERVESCVVFVGVLVLIVGLTLLGMGIGATMALPL